MIVEYIRYAVPGDTAAFEAAWSEAAVYLDRANDCLSYELGRCEEDPDPVHPSHRMDVNRGSSEGLQEERGVSRVLRMHPALPRQHSRDAALRAD